VEPVAEARLEQTKYGLAPVTDGWFVVNVRDAAWVTNEVLGDACIIESDEVSFPQLGYTIAVLQPGQSGGRYHREANQEDFLVLWGECLALVEGEERRLTQWDFVHCPPHTEHAFVGAGEGPCVIFMTGARVEKGAVYTRSELALSHGAGVEEETTESAKAYAPFPKWEPGPPPTWDGLPWAP
jgi:quercetin dioxygenase-like cupin family protein